MNQPPGEFSEQSMGIKGDVQPAQSQGDPVDLLLGEIQTLTLENPKEEEVREQQSSSTGSQELTNAIQEALSAGVRKEDIYSFIRSHQARLMEAGVVNRPQQLKVITTNLHAQTRHVLKEQQEVRGREDAFYTKLQEMKTKYKQALVKLKPMIDKLQERRKPPHSKESFQKHMNDCFNLLNLQRTTPLSPKLTMGLLQRADKFMAQVIIVYSNYMRDMISYTGPHTGTRTVLLARFEDEIGKFARELEMEAQMKQ